MYKCEMCNKTFNDGIMNLAICYICSKIICDNCHHGHCIKTEHDKLLNIIVKSKPETAQTIILSNVNFDFDKLGYPYNVPLMDVDYNQVKRNREILKPYHMIHRIGISDYNYFYCDLIKMKTRFLYQLYKM